MIDRETATALEGRVRSRMPRWQKVLVFASLLFLGLALYAGDYLAIPTIVSPAALTASILPLFLAFIAWCLSWRSLLNASGFPVSVSTAIASAGLPVFGKYIPGKVWAIVGRAAYVAQHDLYPLGMLSAFSLKAQLIDLWTGLILGLIGLYAAGGLEEWGLVPSLAWVTLTIVLFTSSPRQMITHFAKRFLRRDLGLEKLGSWRNIGWATFWSFVTWISLAVGFHLLVLALLGRQVHWGVGLAFPLAATLGIMAVIVPGGLGVREGMLTAFLTMTGLSLTDAVGIALVSRLWYVAGEIFIFFCGLTSAWLSDRESNRSASYRIRK